MEKRKIIDFFQKDNDKTPKMCPSVILRYLGVRNTGAINWDTRQLIYTNGTRDLGLIASLYGLSASLSGLRASLSGL